MQYSIPYGSYLSKETTQVLKKLLCKTKAVPEIQVKGKVYMERKDYRQIQQNEPAAITGGFGQINPVYGVVQLLNLFDEKTERVRITSKSKSIVSDLYTQLTEIIPDVPDTIVAKRNEIEILPSRCDKN